MKTKAWLVLTVIALLLFVNSTSAATDQALNAQEEKVIDYLVKDWGEDYSVTTVDIAMKAVKVDPTD